MTSVAVAGLFALYLAILILLISKHRVETTGDMVSFVYVSGKMVVTQ